MLHLFRSWQLIPDHSQGVSKEAQVGPQLASCHVPHIVQRRMWECGKDEQKANKLTYYDFKAVLQFAAHGSSLLMLVLHYIDAQWLLKNSNATCDGCSMVLNGAQLRWSCRLSRSSLNCRSVAQVLWFGHVQLNHPLQIHQQRRGHNVAPRCTTLHNVAPRCTVVMCHACHAMSCMCCHALLKDPDARRVVRAFNMKEMPAGTQGTRAAHVNPIEPIPYFNILHASSYILVPDHHVTIWKGALQRQRIWHRAVETVLTTAFACLDLVPIAGWPFCNIPYISRIWSVQVSDG